MKCGAAISLTSGLKIAGLVIKALEMAYGSEAAHKMWYFIVIKVVSTAVGASLSVYGVIASNRA